MSSGPATVRRLNIDGDGMPDDVVCIGERYQIGDAEFEVTQPRVTCYRVGVRLGQPELPALLVSHHRPGFYMRVIREGHIQACDQIIKTGNGPCSLSVAETDALLYLPGRDRSRLRDAVSIPALSPGWQQSFQDLLCAHDGEAAEGSAMTRSAWRRCDGRDGQRRSWVQRAATSLRPWTSSVSAGIRLVSHRSWADRVARTAVSALR